MATRLTSPTDLSCPSCDPDRRLDDGSECTNCDGDRISLCDSCGERTATHADRHIGRMCDGCDPAGAADIGRDRAEGRRTEERQERIDMELRV